MSLRRVVSMILLILAGSDCFSQDRPNIVLFLVDDFGWTDTRGYGSDLYETPNIDALQKSGVKFTNAYSACTVCSPSRASILTGKSPARLQITDWITGHVYPYARLLPPKWTEYLPEEEQTIAEVLKARGYKTASIGKWHLGDDTKYYAEHQGFDSNIAGTYQGQPPSYFSPYGISRLKDGPKGEYLTDRLTVEAENFINASKDQPFFLYMPFFAVHTPIQAKPEDISYFKEKSALASNHKNAPYAAMIKSMDESVGRVVAMVEKLGLSENTLFVFTSDNGGLIGGRSNPANTITSNYPLRKGKGSNYEGGIRVPAIFSWKGTIKPGQVSEVPVIGTDLFPTFAAAAGANYSFAEEIDGINLLPLLKGKNSDRRSLFWHYPHYHPEGATPHSAVRKGDWKLIQLYETGELELYNLKNDIAESNNLASTEQAMVKRLTKELNRWKEKTHAQQPVPNPNYDEHRKNYTSGTPRKVNDHINLNK